MKPANASARVREWIPFTVFAMTDTMPKKIKVRDHLFPYEGAKEDSTLIWGLYGTVSINSGLFLAEAYAHAHKKILLTINMWYHVPGFELARNHLTSQTAEEIGFLHLGRVTSEFREALLKEAHEWAKTALHASARSRMKGASLEEFARAHPGFVRYLLREDSPYNLVIHPVQQSYDLSDQGKLWVATGRNKKIFLKGAEVRFIPDIAVSF